MAEEQFAVVIHSRWLETDEPRATVIRSSNGWIWRDVCVTDPDTAQEIADALIRCGEAEAITVIGDWEAVWQAAGRPGVAGESKSLGLLGEIMRLDAEIAALDAQVVAMRAERDCAQIQAAHLAQRLVTEARQ